jgi:peroxiredoxin/mono/diheme cytochrome c family protein
MDATRNWKPPRVAVVALLILAAGVGTATLWALNHGPSRRGRGLGAPVADFTLPDTGGRPVRLSDVLHGRSAVVLAFTGTGCPVGNLYMPRLVDLERRYRGRGVAFLAINANAHETVEEIGAHALDHHLTFPTLKDRGNAVADRLRVERVGEVLLLDGGGRLRYRGAVDDQYARGAFKAEPTRAYLAEALDAVLAGRAVTTAETAVVTCPIDRVEPVRRTLRRPDPAFAALRRKDSPETVEVGPLTYAEHVAPILKAKCQECHRPGEVAPFSLLSFDDARRWAESIYEVVDQGLMPPWHADPRYGHFANDRSLTDRERAVLLAWVEQGAPPGDLDQAPPPAAPNRGWTIGTPDIVLEMPEAFDVPAHGTVPIQKFLVPTNFNEDVWVQAAQALPGDRAVVHHICAFIVDPAAIRSGSSEPEVRRRERPELVCYAPGDMPSIFPPGVAKRVPAGSYLEIQVHYQPVGVPRFDRSAIGLRLARGPIARMAVTRGAANRDFVIPPHSAVTLRGSYTLPEDGHLLSLTPHMHYRGRSFRYEAIYPDGRRETLLSVPCYDFNWQNVYRLAEPKFLPRGTRIEGVARFDNTRANPVNPDPSKEVRWGEQSTDEMMIGYFDYCVELPVARLAGGRDEGQRAKGKGQRTNGRGRMAVDR